MSEKEDKFAGHFESMSSQMQFQGFSNSSQECRVLASDLPSTSETNPLKCGMLGIPKKYTKLGLNCLRLGFNTGPFILSSCSIVDFQKRKLCYVCGFKASVVTSEPLKCLEEIYKQDTLKAIIML